MVDIFLGAIIFSFWCVMLFFGKSVGASMLLFIVPVTLFIIYILKKKQRVVNKKVMILLIPIVLLSSVYLIFNNEFFNMLNLIVIPVLVAIMTLGLINEKLRIDIKLINKVFQVVFKPLSYMHDTFAKLKQELKGKMDITFDATKTDKIKKLIKAICITAPIVILIIVLLSSADDTFKNIFTNFSNHITNSISHIKFSEEFVKVIFIALGFIYLLCFFDYIVSTYESEYNSDEIDKSKKDIFTIKMVLGTLNVIYLIFCAIQINSIFMKDTDIVYSYYARKGFFQLMIVSLINLVTILIAKRREKQNCANGNTYIKIMSLLMILFTFIMLLSAVLRMYFYENAYGYTFLRLLVYFSLFTESILLIPTTLYIIDKKIDLPKVYFSVIITVYIIMNFVNFDYLIAKRNVDRYIEKGKIDTDYLTFSTNTDAVPQMLRLLGNDTYEQGEKAKIQIHLRKIYNSLILENMDFRDFNVSKVYAKYIIEKEKVLERKYETIDNTNKKKDNFIKEDKYVQDDNYMKNDKYISDDIIEFVMYTQKLSDNISIRAVNKGNVLGQRMFIGIEKTVDGEKTWQEQSELTVNIGYKIKFISENIGFINNLGMITTSGENDGLLITIDGGKTFTDANFIFNSNIKDTNFYVSDLPYMMDGKLMVKLYALDNYNIKTVYSFYSEDNGINWRSRAN